jgi:hypothetical protein
MTLNYMVLIALRVFLLTFLGAKAQVQKQTSPDVKRFRSHLRHNVLGSAQGQADFESLHE